MPQVDKLYVIMSRDVSTDAADNMTSILKVVEKFIFGYNSQQMKDQGATLGKEPIIFPIKYAIATSWYFGEKLEQDTFLTFRVNITDPSGFPFGGPNQEHLLPAGIDRINMNFTMDGIPATTAGNYKLSVDVLSKNGKLLATGDFPFAVELNDEHEVKRNANKPSAKKE